MKFDEQGKVEFSSFDEEVSYWTGQLAVAIGRGDMRGTVALIMQDQRQRGYDAAKEKKS